jgi:hypothetical protein
MDGRFPTYGERAEHPIIDRLRDRESGAAGCGFDRIHDRQRPAGGTNGKSGRPPGAAAGARHRLDYGAEALRLVSVNGNGVGGHHHVAASPTILGGPKWQTIANVSLILSLIFCGAIWTARIMLSAPADATPIALTEPANRVASDAARPDISDVASSLQWGFSQ